MCKLVHMSCAQLHANNPTTSCRCHVLHAEFPAAQLAVLEGCLQQFCAYAVSQEVPQVSTIPGGEHVTSADGTMFTTDPTLARYIRSTGSMVASGVLTAGDYFSKGIVQAGEWYRCGSNSKNMPCRIDRAVLTLLDPYQYASM